MRLYNADIVSDPSINDLLKSIISLLFVVNPIGPIYYINKMDRKKEKELVLHLENTLLKILERRGSLLITSVFSIIIAAIAIFCTGFKATSSNIKLLCLVGIIPSFLSGHYLYLHLGICHFYCWNILRYLQILNITTFIDLTIHDQTNT